MQENDQTDQQQKKEPNDPAQKPPGGEQKDPGEAVKQAPGYNETPGNVNEDTGGEVNQRYPAWRPGDEPAAQTGNNGDTDDKDGESPQRSKDQRAGGGS